MNARWPEDVSSRSIRLQQRLEVSRVDVLGVSFGVGHLVDRSDGLAPSSDIFVGALVVRSGTRSDLDFRPFATASPSSRLPSLDFVSEGLPCECPVQPRGRPGSPPERCRVITHRKSSSWSSRESLSGSSARLAGEYVEQLGGPFRTRSKRLARMALPDRLTRCIRGSKRWQAIKMGSFHDDG